MQWANNRGQFTIQLHGIVTKASTYPPPPSSTSTLTSSSSFVPVLCVSWLVWVWNSFQRPGLSNCVHAPCVSLGEFNRCLILMSGSFWRGFRIWQQEELRCVSFDSSLVYNSPSSPSLWLPCQTERKRGIRQTCNDIHKVLEHSRDKQGFTFICGHVRSIVRAEQDLLLMFQCYDST